MNNYSWNLGPDYDPDDFIAHSAHYSKNWNKAKQDAYNAWYYAQNKARILAGRAKRLGKSVSDAAGNVTRTTKNALSDRKLTRDELKGIVSSARSGARSVGSTAKQEAKSAGRDARLTAKTLARYGRNAGRSVGRAVREDASGYANDARTAAGNVARKGRIAGRYVRDKARVYGTRAKRYVTEDDYRNDVNSDIKNRVRTGKHKVKNSSVGRKASMARNSARTQSTIARINAQNTARNVKYHAGNAYSSARNTAHDVKNEAGRRVRETRNAARTQSTIARINAQNTVRNIGYHAGNAYTAAKNTASNAYDTVTGKKKKQKRG